MNIMDAGDTHGYACQRLGAYYLKRNDWAKALGVYSEWKPSSWCGTCLEGMQSRRQDFIRLCQAHLGQFNAAIEQAWRQTVSDQFIDDQLCMFVLVRLYAEAKQLEDLQLLNLRRSTWPFSAILWTPMKISNVCERFSGDYRRLRTRSICQAQPPR